MHPITTRKRGIELFNHEFLTHEHLHELSLQCYKDMLRIRYFEKRAEDLYRRGKMPGLAHLYVGQEAVAVGVCRALQRDDYITSTHRGHGHCLAKGADPRLMFAELLGRADGYCGGKGGTMHIADTGTNNLGANAIVGGSVGIAAGAAFSSQRLGTGRVVVSFFGDGALGQGILYEIFNLAALWRLPLVFACEDNLYSEFTAHSETLAGDLLARAEAFGIPSKSVDGQDVHAVLDATDGAVEAARSGAGPTFLLLKTYRYGGHHVGDVDKPYRQKTEEQEWRSQRDCISNLGRWLEENDVANRDGLAAVDREAKDEMAAAAAWALDAPFPTSDQVDEDVYAL